jgi:hypothetical protein
LLNEPFRQPFSEIAPHPLEVIQKCLVVLRFQKIFFAQHLTVEQPKCSSASFVCILSIEMGKF